jgi:hypothetical protein
VRHARPEGIVVRALVIARAFGGEPLRRVAVKCDHGLIYLAHPDFIEAVERGDSHPVGFPERDVYAYDAASFSVLEMEWRETGATTTAQWAKLMQFPKKNEAAN